MVLALLLLRSGPVGREVHLDAAIKEAAEGHDGVILDMAAITGFAWQEMFIFSGYASAGDVQDALGFWWSPPSGAIDRASSDVALLVFVDNGTVVAYTLCPRSSGDFLLNSNRRHIRRERARFAVRHTMSAGHPWCVLELQR